MSGSKKPVLIAWDSCVWIAWFKRERNKPLDDIRDVLKESESGASTVLLSVVCFSEVLDTTEAAAGTSLREYAKRKNVYPADVDFRVADKASEIRKKSILANTSGSGVNKIKTPDALIAATAIVYKATVLHSFDPDLLSVSETEIVDGLKIIPPKTISPAEKNLLIEFNDETEEPGPTHETDQSLSADAGGGASQSAEHTSPEGASGEGKKDEEAT